MLDVFSTLRRRMAAPFRKKSAQERFCELNRTFWEGWRTSCPPTDPDAVIVTPLTNNAFVVLSAVVPATLVSAVKGASPLFLHKKNPKTRMWWADIVESFGRCRIDSIRNYAGDPREIEAEAREILKGIVSPAALLDFSYHGVPLGDSVYDTSMRVKPWQASVWEIDEKRVLSNIIAAISAVRATERICATYDVRAAAIDRGHTPYLCGLMRTFASRGIDCYMGTDRLIKRRGRTRDPYHPPLRPARSLVDRALELRRTEVTTAAQAFFNAHFAEPPADDPALRFRTPQEFCARFEIDPSKPCVFVMLHAFNDYPHSAGRIAFQDFYFWTLETLEIARQVKSVNWIFKQHPGIEYYPADLDAREIFSSVKEPHIRFLDENQHINRPSIARIAHAIITCIGSAGLEYSCCGVPAVTGGESHYSGFDFVHECSTREEYRATLEQIHRLPRLDEKQVEMARIILYLSTADFYTGPLSLIPTLTHGERLKPDVDMILDHIVAQFDSPDTLKALQDFRAFVEDENAVQYLNPNFYPSLDGLITVPRPFIPAAVPTGN